MERVIDEAAERRYLVCLMRDLEHSSLNQNLRDKIPFQPTQGCPSRLAWVFSCLEMNHHPIINGKCQHCEKFRLAYEVIDGVCSWAIPVRPPKPSQEVIQKAAEDMEKRKLVTRGHHGWNK